MQFLQDVCKSCKIVANLVRFLNQLCKNFVNLACKNRVRSCTYLQDGFTWVITEDFGGTAIESFFNLSRNN